jgi:hypothetical protein
MLTWGIVLALVGVLAYFSSRMARHQDADGLQDMGLAIMEFGRAFPQEAIRSLHATADGKAVFVRLHDNKAGFMRNMRSHYACHLIEPGTVRVRDLGNGTSFGVEFLEAPFHNGEFRFATAAEAAEVSLWLLGNYVSPADHETEALPST